MFVTDLVILGNVYFVLVCILLSSIWGFLGS